MAVIRLTPRTVTPALLRSWLPRRPREAHKGDFGKLLLLCGAVGYTGAPALAAMGALRTGAGLVYLGVPETVYPIVAAKLNEPVVFPLPAQDGMLSEKAIPEILRRLAGCNACLIGCGLGRSEGTRAVVEAVLTHATCPVVLDADGINVLEGHIDILRGAACPVILTPHEGEFRRLGGGLEGQLAGGAEAFQIDRRGRPAQGAPQRDRRSRRLLSQPHRESRYGHRRQRRCAGGRDRLSARSGAVSAACRRGRRMAARSGGRPLRGAAW